MALAIALAPFRHIKAFDDLETFLKAIHAEPGDIGEAKTEDYYSLIADSIGFNDDPIDEPMSIAELTEAINSKDNAESWSAVRSLGRGGF
jgi:hypothetical protein